MSVGAKQFGDAELLYSVIPVRRLRLVGRNDLGYDAYEPSESDQVFAITFSSGFKVTENLLGRRIV